MGMQSVQTKEEILEYLREHRERLRRTYHLRSIALIGSFARDEQHDGSDIDLLITLEQNTEKIFELKGALREELQRAFGRTVEPANETYLKPFYREEILSDAIYA